MCDRLFSHLCQCEINVQCHWCPGQVVGHIAIVVNVHVTCAPRGRLIANPGLPHIRGCCPRPHPDLAPHDPGPPHGPCMPHGHRWYVAGVAGHSTTGVHFRFRVDKSIPSTLEPPKSNKRDLPNWRTRWMMATMPTGLDSGVAGPTPSNFAPELASSPSQPSHRPAVRAPAHGSAPMISDH